MYTQNNYYYQPKTITEIPMLMKTPAYFWIFIILPQFIIAQELATQKIESTIHSATVFFNSAQVYRTSNFALKKGKQELRFVNLSPFVNQKSIQFQLPNVEILSINFEKNHTAATKPNSEEQRYLDRLQKVEESIQEKTIALTINQEEIEFLKSNRSIGGNQTLSVAAIKEAATFYSSQMKVLKTKEAKLKKELDQKYQEKKNIEKELKEYRGKKPNANGEIILTVNALQAKNITANFNYNVDNVSWYPSYDLRVKDIKSPLEIIYKANLKQNSQVDWKDVQLRFSSANPNESNQLGELIPYFINYGTRPPRYQNKIEEVSGYVTDGKTPLPGVNVSVTGTSIGTTTNFDGKYTIQVPKDSKTLEFSYLGYQRATKLITNSTMNVILREDHASLDEVVVVGYGVNKKRSTPRSRNMAVSEVMEEEETNVIDTEITTNQTSFELNVVKPYTVLSSNKDFVISMVSYKTNANYTYFSIPRIDKAAFLKASIKDWQKMNLLEGLANVYLENTFIGSTLLDTRTAEKELQIALGKDKSVLVDRIKDQDFTSEQFIGNKKEQNFSWTITIKNNKQTDINIVVLDQIPVSTQEEIKITLDKSFTGTLESKTGKVKWNREIVGGMTEKLNLTFSVKFPKDRRLYID